MRQRKQERPVALFAGGGTGGHVFPGLAVAGLLRQRRDVSVVWIGSSRGIEREIVGQAGVAFHAIPTGKLRRYLSFRNLTDLFGVVSGVMKSIGLMRTLKPAFLFSKGGYASVPPTIAAWLTGVPVITHDSDADPGLATRINTRFARRILVPYESSRDHFRPRVQKRVVVTGNPIREDLFAGSRTAGLATAGFRESDDRPIALFLGGSLGARQINELVGTLQPRLSRSWRIIHQTGDRSDDIHLPPNGEAYYRQAFFNDEYPGVLACADLVVCRAGASTLWEAAALSKPMVLIPLKSGSRGDQVRNASVFEQAGAAHVIDPELSDEGRLADLLAQLGPDHEKRASMGRNARELIHIDSTDQIVTILEQLMDQKLESHETPGEE